MDKDSFMLTFVIGMVSKYAQELLSTFSTALGEVALQPSTGGTFVVGIVYTPPPAPQRSPAPTTQGASESTAGVSSDPPLDVQTETPSTREPVRIQHKVLWDRKVDGGFPETKELKRRVRDVIEPERNLGHVDREYPKGSAATAAASKEADATKVKGEEVDGRDGDTTKVLASGGGQGKEECEDCK